MTVNQSPAENLSAEILADAQRRAEEIIIHAQKDAEVFLAGASAEAAQTRQKLIEQARAEAAHQSQLILATIPVETVRLQAARVEALLESVYEEISQRLLAREGFKYRETVISLASDAIHQMDGVEFVIRLSSTGQTVVDNGLAEEIVRYAGRSVTITVLYDKDITEDGVIIEDAGARQVWDNRLLKRLERLWPELRRRIALEASLIPKTGTEGDG